MRFILTTLIAIFLAFTAAAQSPIFEFECFSNANMTGDSCDICVGTSFQSRSFNGLMVYRLGVFNRWIDEPYLIRLRPGNSVEFIEQTGTSPDRITIPLNQTGFSTISGFIDSTFCAGANIDFSFFASDSLRTTAINYLDTIKIVGRGGTTVFFDTLTQKYIITSPAGGGGGGGTTYTAGTGIAISGGNVISNTSPNINQTISTTGAAGNITLSNSGGMLNLNVNDADANPTNEIQALSTNGSAGNISLSNGGGTININVNDADANPTNEIQALSTNGSAGNISLSNGGGTININVNDADANPTNEIQTLSYSAPNLSLSLGGGSVAIPQGDITGSGTGNQVTFFTGTKTVTGSSRFTVNNSSLAGLILNGGDGAGGNGSYVLFQKDGTNNFIFGAESSLFGGTGTGGAIFQYGDNPFFFCTNGSKRAVLLGNGNFGIGTLSPSRLFHVEGAARITGSAGTGTSVMLRDASGDVSNATLGAGLSLSGGTLSSTATGTVTGTGTAGKVAYWNGTSALTATTNFAFDGTNLAVGAATPGAGRLNVTGNSTSVGLQVDAQTLPSFGSTLQLRGSNSTSNQSFSGLDAEGITTGSGSNYLNKFGNTGAGNTLLQVNTTAAGGDPVVQYNLTGGSANWVHGIDNSDADKFKIQPYSMPGVGSAGITITTAGLVGINQEIPAVALDISTATNGIAIPNGTTAQRPVASVPIIRYNSETQGLEVKNSGNWHLLNSQVVPSLVAGSGLGTSAVLTVNGGFETAYTVSMTVGTAPTANGVIYTRNFPFTWSSAPRAVFSAANALTASEITKFYIETTNSSQYTIRANGTLTTGSTYRLNVLVKN